MPEKTAPQRPAKLAEGKKMKHLTKTSKGFSGVSLWFCSWALALLNSSIYLQAKVLPKTAHLVPPETVLLIDIDNFNQLKRQFEKTNFYKLYEDPAMAAFVEDFKTKWHEKIRQENSKFIRAIADADVLPQGRVAIALVLNEQTKDANEPSFLFITQWGEHADKIKEAIHKMVEKAVPDGAHQRTESYRAVTINTIILRPAQAVSYCFVDDCLIVSMNLDTLKFVIAHIKGATSPTLADDDDYTTTIKAIGPHHDIDFYANIKQILRMIIVKYPAGKAKTSISNLGLENVTSFGCSIALARAAGSSGGKAFLKVDGTKKGICKMLEIESTTIKAPRFIPASAYSITFLNLSVKKFYNELYNILYSFDPKIAAVMHTPLLPPSPDGQPGVELKADIINHLGSQIVIAQRINKPVTSNTGQLLTESLVALQVSNRHALEKSLSLLHRKMIAPSKTDARRELLGHTIYLLDLPALLPHFTPGKRTPMQTPTGPLAPKIPKMAFTITDSHLILGFESAVERAIRTLSSTETAPLSSVKWFGQAKASIPSTVGVASLQNNAESSKILWQMLKESAQSRKQRGKDSTIKMGVGMSPGSFLPQVTLSEAGAERFDFTLLPEFDTVRKYFGLSTFYGLSRPDGFFFEFKYLNPPGNE